MKKCPACGRETAGDGAFCPHCGSRLAAVPPQGQAPQDPVQAAAAIPPQAPRDPVPGAPHPAGQLQDPALAPGAALSLTRPLYTAEVKGLLKSGTLAVYADRAEFSTSSVQKTVFDYSDLLAVKKGLDRINFITGDGRTESCAVSRKHIHEAFLYIDKASRPYIEQRKAQLRAGGIQYSLVSTMGLSGGLLNILADRVEFTPRSGQPVTVPYAEVRTVGLTGMGGLELSLIDGQTRAFSLEKELREEVQGYVRQAAAPFIAARIEQLRAQGIFYSFPSSCEGVNGILNILADRAEFAAGSQCLTIRYEHLRAVRIQTGSLDLALTDGTARCFLTGKDAGEGLAEFLDGAVRPYILRRTEGFETSFGLDEKLEINPGRGVFHILRQGGNEITDEYPLAGLVRCEWAEESSRIGDMLSGGRALLNNAARGKGTAKAEETVSRAGVRLTLSGKDGETALQIWFGEFPLGVSRQSPKYERCLAAGAAWMDWLAQCCPACTLSRPGALLSASGGLQPTLPGRGEGEQAGAGTQPPALSSALSEDQDQFGILHYIEGVSDFIRDCTAPMTIAIQGSLASGRNSILQLLAAKLGEWYSGEPVWCSALPFSQTDPSAQLPLLVGERLSGLLSGENGPGAKDRAIKAAKGLIGITSGFISQGSSDGQNLLDAIFRDGGADSLEKQLAGFGQLVQKRAGGSGGKVIFLVNDLDQLAPARAARLLDAMRAFLNCEGCVFVVAVDRAAVIRGAVEHFGPQTDGRAFFDRLFQVSFRVPVSGFNIDHYIQDKLRGVSVEPDEEELGHYAALIRHSVGSEPRAMDRLFNSFLLLQKLADPALYANRDQRLMLFSLICMQTRFAAVYDQLVQKKAEVTAALLNGLCGERPALLEGLTFAAGEAAAFRDFAAAFCGVINIDRQEGISDQECGAFARVLEFSSITSQ